MTLISIHALLAESDAAGAHAAPVQRYFYPRSPCGERRHWQTGQSRTRQFLSTLSLRRATTRFWSFPRRIIIFLSTLSLRRATAIGRQGTDGRDISIHALLAESDHTRITALFDSPLFLSTLSLRRATARQRGQVGVVEISIHALLAESDSISFMCVPLLLYFYPRSPCGERRCAALRCVIRAISIHALLAESDGSRRCPTRPS